MVYIDDRVFVFGSQKEIKIRTSIIQRQFSRLELQMHNGNITKDSKTKAIFFPQPGFFKELSLPSLETSASFCPLIVKPKQESVYNMTMRATTN